MSAARPPVAIAGIEAVFDASGALFLPAERMLVVADLHLERGSAGARRRALLPPYDSASTLLRLAKAVGRYGPRSVVALGDSFHDPGAPGRLGREERGLLAELQHGREWVWIAGNHDPKGPGAGGGAALPQLALGPLVLRHVPGPRQAGAFTGEIAGHLHPAARVVTGLGSVRRRCFAADPTRCILPAFGAFAGGLNVRDPAIAGLFAGALTAFVLGRERVHPVPAICCAPESRGSVPL